MVANTERRTCTRPPRIQLLVFAICIVASFAKGQESFFRGLGVLPGSLGSTVEAVSGDGSVVVGLSSFFPQTPADRPYRWSSDSGMVFFGSANSFVTDLSGDGAVTVGSDGGFPVRWTAAGLERLGDLPGGESDGIAWGVSQDGRVAVGRSKSTNGFEAFRWTAGDGMMPLGNLPGGGPGFEAVATSADGAVVVGRSDFVGGSQPFRWTQADGMVGLGSLTGYELSAATNVSNDGRTIVGWSHVAPGGNEPFRSQAFRWTAETGMVGLSEIPGGKSISMATAVSRSGARVVGLSDGPSGEEAVIWDRGGMQNLQRVLENVPGTGDLLGWTLTRAVDISDDGRTIVGWGNNNGRSEAWIARLPQTPEPLRPPSFHSRLPAPTGASNLVLITHGWTNSSDPASDEAAEAFGWVQDMANPIRAALPRGTGGWDVIAYDWRDLASTGRYDLIGGDPLEGIAFAKQALGNASLLGSKEGSIVAARGYEHVHLIAHSAGSAFAHEVSQAIKRDSQGTTVHITFLDSFVPETWYQANLGKAADWAEQYFARGREPLTQELLLNAHNVDVTAINERADFDFNHDFPHNFYFETVRRNLERDEPAQNWQGYGFNLAREASNGSPWNPIASHPPGLVVLGGSDSQERLGVLTRDDQPIDFSTAPRAISETGEVAIDGTEIDLTSGSPVWLAASIQLLDEVNFLAFNLEFTDPIGGDGVLAVYFDNRLLMIFEEENVTDLIEVTLPLDSYAPGLHSIGFHLDSPDAIRSSASISDVHTGLITIVPEPGSLHLAILALIIGVATVKARFKARQKGRPNGFHVDCCHSNAKNIPT